MILERTWSALMLEGAGFEIIDLGVDVPGRGVCETSDRSPTGYRCHVCPADDHHAIHANNHRCPDRRGLRNHVKVIVGGAPVTESYAQQIEADGFSTDASRAVNVVNELLGN